MKHIQLVVGFGAVCLVSCETESPRWRPVAGESRFTFVSTEASAGRGSTVEVDVVVRSGEAGGAMLEVEAARSSVGNGDMTSIDIDSSCRKEFAGGSQVIGTIAVSDSTNPHAVVPQCVPENVFGAITDLIAILLVQGPRFRIDELMEPGDSVRFSGFDARWARSKPLMHARVVATGGFIKLQSVSADEAHVRWRPDPMAVSIARQLSSPRWMVLRGNEDFELELRIDPRSGRLLGARATVDHLSMEYWIVSGPALPPLEEPPGRGEPLEIRRTIALNPR